MHKSSILHLFILLMHVRLFLERFYRDAPTNFWCFDVLLLLEMFLYVGFISSLP
jgi:hypothetical protein